MRINNRTKITFLIVIGILLIVSLIAYSKTEASKVQQNTKSFVNKLEKALKSGSTTVKMQELTDFQWDDAFLFRPYSSKKDIELQTGIKSSFFTNSLRDEEYQLIFIKNNKVVAYVNGKDYSSFSFQYPMAISVTYLNMHKETGFKVEKEAGLFVLKILL